MKLLGLNAEYLCTGTYVGRTAYRSHRQPCMGGKTTAHNQLTLPPSHRPCAHGFLRVHCGGRDAARAASAMAKSLYDARLAQQEGTLWLLVSNLHSF